MTSQPSTMTSKRSKEVSGSLEISMRRHEMADFTLYQCHSIIVAFYFIFFFISDDTEVLIESAKTAASASNSTVSNITERLRNISQEVDRITLTNGNTDNILTGADQACEY